MLHDRQREMQNVLQHRVLHLPSDRTAGGLDETEHAEADIQEHIEVALIQMKGDTLRRVREALVRLDAGEYGYCAECGGEIARNDGCRRCPLPFAAPPVKNRTSSRPREERRSASPQGFSLIFTGSTGA
ncbi:MAG: hypothetical protein MZW92_53440 [Comamonadaceae bacterium]|nr:hypothetical protein [Comamonadaceae bacterium]